MTALGALPFSLDTSCPIPWNDSAESQLHHDFPFLNEEDTDQNFVIRRYLETLWLPESFNPLQHLITSMRRIHPSSTSPTSEPHPLHNLLEPLLLPVRASSEKYRSELAQILDDGGGAGEQEELMMWYAWEYEKVQGDNEEKWKKEWLERLERREAMIQILLNMLKLSLPGPKPCEIQQKPKKRRKKQVDPPPETDADRLESYMDKLSVWQLTSSINELAPGLTTSSSSQGNAKADRHWTQAFCEDVVESLFKSNLPDFCELLRSKIFPTSPFSEAEDSDVDTVLDGGAPSRAGSRAPSVSRSSSHLTRLPSAAPSEVASSTAYSRSRSRSLSVSLARDEKLQRASIIEPKRTTSREISMSRVFKAKLKPVAKPKQREEPKQVKAKAKNTLGKTLIAETPAKNRIATQVVQETQISVLSPPPTSSPGDIFIADTPFFSRSAARSEPAVEISPLSPLTPLRGASAKRRVADTNASTINIDTWEDEDADESFTGSFGSPEVMLLSDGPEAQKRGSVTKAMKFGLGRKGGVRSLSMRMASASSVAALDAETPTKKRARRK